MWHVAPPGRPPDGLPEEGSWAIARGLRSMFGWPQQNAAPALPPLSSSGQQAPSEYGPLLDGGVHRPSVPDPALTRANGNTSLVTLCHLYGIYK